MPSDRRRLCHLLLATILLLPSVTATADPLEDFHTWLNVTATGTLGGATSPWRFWMEMQGRFDDDSSRFFQSIVRPGVGYTLSPSTSLWAGYAWIPTDPPGNGPGTLTEHRGWQQLIWNAPQPVAGFNFTSRSRLEQRNLDSGDDVGWRVRQLLRTVHPLGTDTPWTLVVQDELFVNLNSTDWGAADGFDQNRGFAGVGYKLSAHARTEVGYMNHYLRRSGNVDRMNHLLSLNLFLTF